MGRGNECEGLSGDFLSSRSFHQTQILNVHIFPLVCVFVHAYVRVCAHVFFLCASMYLRISTIIYSPTKRIFLLFSLVVSYFLLDVSLSDVKLDFQTPSSISKSFKENFLLIKDFSLIKCRSIFDNNSPV